MHNNLKVFVPCEIAVCALFAIAILVPARAADEPSPAEHAAATTRPADDGRALHEEMEAANRSLRALTRQIKDKSRNASSLTLIAEMQKHTLASKSMTPGGAATRPADEQPKYLTEYRQRIIQVLKTELDLEQQILEGKNDEAANTIKSLRQLEQQGHKAFVPPRDRD